MARLRSVVASPIHASHWKTSRSSQVTGLTYLASPKMIVGPRAQSVVDTFSLLPHRRQL
jgi:hypothetical protein